MMSCGNLLVRKDWGRDPNRGKFQIGRVLHFKSEIRSFKLDGAQLGKVQSETSDFGFEMQDSSNLKF
jgi:hypothetical protein